MNITVRVLSRFVYLLEEDRQLCRLDLPGAQAVIEIRRVVFGPNEQIEYRHLIFGVDASGALCPGPGWSDWQVVKTIDGNDAALQDLIASGGIVGAP